MSNSTLRDFIDSIEEVLRKNEELKTQYNKLKDQYQGLEIHCEILEADIDELQRDRYEQDQSMSATQLANNFLSFMIDVIKEDTSQFKFGDIFVDNISGYSPEDDKSDPEPKREVKEFFVEQYDNAEVIRVPSYPEPYEDKNYRKSNKHHKFARQGKKSKNFRKTQHRK